MDMLYTHIQMAQNLNAYIQSLYTKNATTTFIEGPNCFFKKLPALHALPHAKVSYIIIVSLP